MIHTNIESDFEQFLHMLKHHPVPHNQIVNFYPPQMSENKKATLKDPSDPYMKGIYNGHLYETYVLNKLVHLASHHPDIDWVLIPSFSKKNGVKKTVTKKKSTKKKPAKNDQNGMNYDKEGALVLLREGFPIAEFDAILSFRGIPVLFEMKCSDSNQNIDYDAILVRSLRLEMVCGKVPFVVIILNRANFPSKIIDGCSTQTGWFLLNIDDYQDFFTYFDRKMQCIPIFKSNSTKFPNMQKVFPKPVNFGFEKVLRDAILSPKLSSEQIIEQYSSKLKFFTKIAMGKLNYPIQIPLNIKNGSNPISNFISNQIPIVVYFSHNTIDFTLEFVAAKQIGKKKNQNIPKSTLDLDSLTLSNMANKVTRFSYFFHQVKRMANQPVVSLITEKKLSLLIKRCQELTQIQHKNNP